MGRLLSVVAKWSHVVCDAMPYFKASLVPRDKVGLFWLYYYYLCPLFLDCTTVVDMTAPPSASGRTSRRMFMQLVYDSSASATQVWHLELRWLMCQGQQVEEIVKHCTRRARQAGLLLLQIPTELEWDAASNKNRVLKGFYHHQWRTQFAEKGLTTHKLHEKILTLQMQIETHQRHIETTHANLSKWRAAGKGLMLFKYYSTSM